MLYTPINYFTNQSVTCLTGSLLWDYCLTHLLQCPNNSKLPSHQLATTNHQHFTALSLSPDGGTLTGIPPCQHLQQAIALGVAPTLVPSLQPEPKAASLCFFIQLLFLFYTRHSHAPREADSWCSRKAVARHLDWVDASCLSHISALSNKIGVFSFLLSHASIFNC